MLHHYNYSASSLPHLLSYNQQLEDQNSENEQTSTNSFCEQLSQHMIPMCKSSSSVVNNKSFTIAAILGLKNDNNHHSHQEVMVKNCNTPTDLSVVNLSVHQATTDRSLISNCGRLQLPVRHGSSDGMTEHYTVGHGCSAVRSGVRGLKHLSSAVMSNKKNCKSKRVRTIFTPEQLERLEAEFERQQYMVGPERLYLAHTLQLTEAQVKVWFQNRRIKWRKHHLELTHQRLAVLKQQQQLLLDESHPDNQDTNSSSTDT